MSHEEHTGELAHALRVMLSVYCGEEGKTPADCERAAALAAETLAKWGHEVPADCQKD
jgi:hypothetical protein